MRNICFHLMMPLMIWWLIVNVMEGRWDEIISWHQFQLNLYMQRLITLDALVKELTFRKLNRQYFFGTEHAIKKLKRI